MHEAELNPGKGDALIIVDVQNDFLPGGAAPAADGHEVLEPLNRTMALFDRLGLPVVATRDWHPPDLARFTTQGGPWPPHCVQGTRGAEFAPGLCLPASALVISKGLDGDRDAHSAFSDGSFQQALQDNRVVRIMVGGVTAEYCVFKTVRDALERGYRVVLLTDAIRGVDANPGDSKRAINEMIRLGAIPAETGNLA